VYPVDLAAGVFIEAEGSSRRAGPFQRVNETGRGNDAFIRVDPAATSAVDAPDEGNVMWYDLDVGQGGSGYLWVLGNGPASTSDTVFVSVNGGPDQAVTLTPAAWGWSRGKTALNLPRGKQTLKIKAAKAGAQLDRIWLTSDANATAPDGLGAAAPDTPCSKGQVLEPPNGGSGAGGSAGAGMAEAGSAGHVAGGSGTVGGAGPMAGAGPVSGTSAGGTTANTSAAEHGCDCRTVLSSQPASDRPGLWGVLSGLGVAWARRSRRLRRARRC
jgi:hypothetical protein